MSTPYADVIARDVFDFTDSVDTLSDADCRFILHTLGRLVRINPEDPSALADLVGIVMDLAAQL